MGHALLLIQSGSRSMNNRVVNIAWDVRACSDGALERSGLALGHRSSVLSATYIFKK